MTPHQTAADGTEEPDLPDELPTDHDQPGRPRPGGPPQVHVDRLRARIETLTHERNLWRARAHENSLALDRQKARLTELERLQREVGR